MRRHLIHRDFSRLHSQLTLLIELPSHKLLTMRLHCILIHVAIKLWVWVMVSNTFEVGLRVNTALSSDLWLNLADLGIDHESVSLRLRLVYMQAKTIGVLTTSHHVVSWSLLLRASRFDFLYLQLYLSPILVISFSVADEGCHAFFDWGGWAIRFLGKLSLALPHCPGEGYDQFHDRCKLVLIVLLLLHEMFDQLLHPLHLIFVECAGFCLSIFIFVGA